MLDGKGKEGKLMSLFCCFDYQTGISLIIYRVEDELIIGIKTNLQPL